VKYDFWNVTVLPEDSHLIELFWDDYSTRRHPYINLFWDDYSTRRQPYWNLFWDMIILPEDRHI